MLIYICIFIYECICTYVTIYQWGVRHKSCMAPQVELSPDTQHIFCRLADYKVRHFPFQIISIVDGSILLLSIIINIVPDCEYFWLITVRPVHGQDR